MALRIIRKSTSKSHVELLKGTDPNEKIELSLICHLTGIESAKAVIAFIEKNTWVAEHFELIYIQGKDLESPLRPLLPTLKNTSKLMIENAEQEQVIQLKAALSESSGKFCIHIQDTCPDESILKAMISHLKSHPNIGVCGPVQKYNEVISSAGLAPSKGEETLYFGDEKIEYKNASPHIVHLFQGSSQSVINQLPSYFQVPAIDLSICAFNKQAFESLDLNLSDKEIDKNTESTALNICLLMRQKQYDVHLLSHSIQVQKMHNKVPFKELAFSEYSELLSTLYTHDIYLYMGFKENRPEHYTFEEKPTMDDLITKYINEKQG